MMSKKKIAMLVAAVLGSVLIGAILFAYYDFTHNSPLTSVQVSDAQIALKGALGEAIFGGQHPEVIPDLQLEGKTGLDALLAPGPGGSKGEGLIKAYHENPQKFKRYAEMLDTAMNAKQVGDMLRRRAASRPNRMGGFPASGSRRKAHDVAHGRWRGHHEPVNLLRWKPT